MKRSEKQRLEKMARRPSHLRTMREHDTPEGRLLDICELANAQRGTERGQAFISLLEKWMKARSLAEMVYSDMDLASDLSRATFSHFEPSKTGKGGKYVVTPSAPIEGVPESSAIWLFANLVTNPLCDDFAGPCARCEKYYVRKRPNQKSYCSKSCGSTATAEASNSKKLKEERDAKLKNARQLIREYNSLAQKSPDWKGWIQKRDPSITRSWLTRAVNPENSYGLKPPRVERQHA